jgi:hypothetical protein
MHADQIDEPADEPYAYSCDSHYNMQPGPQAQLRLNSEAAKSCLPQRPVVDCSVGGADCAANTFDFDRRATASFNWINEVVSENYVFVATYSLAFKHSLVRIRTNRYSTSLVNTANGYLLTAAALPVTHRVVLFASCQHGNLHLHVAFPAISGLVRGSCLLSALEHPAVGCAKTARCWI